MINLFKIFAVVKEDVLTNVQPDLIPMFILILSVGIYFGIIDGVKWREIDTVDTYIPEVQLEHASNLKLKKICVFIRFNRLLDEI